MVQIQPTGNRTLMKLVIPPTAVRGLFRACIESQKTPALFSVYAPHTLISGAKAGSEPSPNCRWGDSKFHKRAVSCRLDLNDPPTAVGGISEFSIPCFVKRSKNLIIRLSSERGRGATTGIVYL